MCVCGSGLEVNLQRYKWFQPVMYKKESWTVLALILYSTKC